MCEQGSELTQIQLAYTTKNLKTHALVDPCIAGIIQMFNDAGYRTVASCCGHGVRPGIISLENGTELILCYSYKQARTVEKLYPGLHEEMDGKIPPPMNVDDYAKLVNELETELKLQEKDNKRIIQLSKTAHENMESDRDALIVDRNNLKDRISELFEENAELVKKRAIDQTKMEGQWVKIQETEKEVEFLKGLNLAYIEKCGDLDTKNEELTNELDTQKAGWDASTAVVNNLVKEIVEMTKTIDILRDGHTQEELNTIQDYKTEIHNLRKQVDLIHDTSNEIKTERDSLKVTLSALRTASKFKKEYDPKWQKDNLRLDKEIERLNKELQRIHTHWHRQTSGYMNKIKNQRRQLKQYQKCKERLNERINTLYPYIVHGDMDHRKWLRKAIEDHFNMYKPDPKPKMGMETKTFSQSSYI